MIAAWEEHAARPFFLMHYTGDMADEVHLVSSFSSGHDDSNHSLKDSASGNDEDDMDAVVSSRE